MIYVKNAVSNAGVEIFGDPLEFEQLYDSLHEIIDKEETYAGYDAVGTRVLVICYELRHALMGDRAIEFVDNGMDDEKKRRLAILAPDKNVYYKIKVLWPEMLFVMVALNDFVTFYAKKKTRQYFDMMARPKVAWDPSITAVRQFQSAVSKCLQETVSPGSYSRMINILCKDYHWAGGYTWQYVDVLNRKFLDMTPEKRLKKLPMLAKQIAEPGTEYQAIRAAILAAAKLHNTQVDNIAPPVDPHEEFSW